MNRPLDMPIPERSTDNDPAIYLKSFAQTGLGFLLWDRRKGIVHSNEAFARLLGDDINVWKNVAFEMLIARLHPDERAMLASVVQAGFGPGLSERSFEIRLGHRLGHWLSLSVAISGVHCREDGNAQIILCSFIDVTASRVGKRQWRARAELASDWFWETDAKQRITVINETYAALLGVKLGDQAESGFGAEIAQFLGDPVAFKRLKFSTKDAAGSPRWYELDGRPVFNAHGTWTGFEGVARDVTERERIVEDAQSTVATLDALVDSIPIPIFLKDLDGIYTKVNEAFRQLVGISDQDILGKRSEEVFDPEFVARHQAEDDRVLKTREVLKYEVQQHFQGAGIIDALFRKAPIVDAHGEALGIVGLIVDVTQQRELERTLRKAKESAESASLSKSSFLAAMSHEIRTPMNGVLGMAEMLSQDVLNDDQAEAVNIIRQSATNLLSLIDDILDFSKIDSGHIELDTRCVEVSRVVSLTMESLIPVSLQKGVRLRSFVAPGVPSTIFSDDTRIRQVLTNLVGNAIKFSAGREGVVGDVYLRVTSQDGESLCFQVIDNGIGISAENIPKMFNAFTQAERSTTRRFGGTGLGLAISQKIASLLGGTLTVTSEPGLGSEFTLKVPLVEPFGDVRERLPNLASVTCVLLEPPSVPGNDLGLALRTAGAYVRRANSIEQAQAMLASKEQTSVLVLNAREKNERELTKEIQSKAWPINVNHLVLTEGLRKSLRMLGERIACVDVGQFETAVKAVGLLTANSAYVEPSAPLRKSAVDTADQSGDEELTVRPGIRVLVAEDDPINQRVISRQLRSLGVEVDLAVNGYKALEMWRANGNYHAILTDMHMPEMDGYGLARSIRSEEAPGEHISILALTANAINGESFEAYQAGIDVYLTKPILIADLAKALAVYAVSDDTPEHIDEPKVLEPTEKVVLSPPKSSAPVFDPDYFSKLMGGDESLMNDLLEGFADEGAKLVDEITMQLYRDQKASSKELAHRLKSASRSVGAMALGELAQHIESQIEKLLAKDSQALAVQVQKEFELFLVQAKSSALSLEI